jgi:hypothetical protein
LAIYPARTLTDMEVVNKLGRFIKLEEVSHTIHALFWVRKKEIQLK